jgi:hypothetical protein
MGSSIGPIDEALGNLSIALDASNLNSYSGSGNTSYDLITRSTAALSSVTYSTSGSVGFFDFSGSGSVTSSNNIGITGANSRTLSCWAYFNAKSTYCLMSIGVNGSGTGWGIETGATTFTLTKGNSGTITAVTYNASQWYNIVYVGQNLSANSLTVSFYINGSLQYSGTDTSINTTNSPLKVGLNPSGFVSFNGRIAQAKVYNKALSANEIKKNYDGLKSKFGL